MVPEGRRRAWAGLGLVLLVAAGCGSSAKPATAPTSTGSSTTATGPTAPAGTPLSPAPPVPSTTATSASNAACDLLTAAEIDAAAGHPTEVSDAGSETATGTLDRGQCLWRSSNGRNVVVVTTTASGATASGVGVFPGLGSGSTFVTATSSPSRDASCVRGPCQFTAATTLGHRVVVGAFFDPPAPDAMAAAKVLVTAMVERLGS